MNEKLFLILFNSLNKNKSLSKSAAAVSKASFSVFLLSFSAGIIYLALNKNIKIFPYLTVPFITISVNKFLRNIFKKSRPFQKLNIKASVEHKNTYSFPSNHSAASMIIAASIMYVNFKIGILFLALAFITGLSRIFTGLHYPCDVLAAWIEAALFSAFGFYFIPKIIAL